MTEAFKPSEFQVRIVRYLETVPNGFASCWEIAQVVFPERWQRRAARGALIGHIRRAGYRLGRTGYIACVLPPAGEWGDWTLCLGFESDRKRLEV